MTLIQAQKHLDAWLEADLSLATGEEYTIDGIRLRRSNADYVRNQIEYWTAMVNRLQGNRQTISRRVVPIDL